MSVLNKLSQDIAFNLDDRPKKGLEGCSGVLINYDDIDFTATKIVGAKLLTLVLKTGTTGYKVAWYKELASAGSEFAANAEDIDGFNNSFLCRLATSTLENAEISFELSQGRFLFVGETEYKGIENEDAFKVYGFDSGMKLSEMTGKTNENSGSMLFTLSTREGTSEKYPYRIFLENAIAPATPYSASKAAFDSLFAEAR